MNFGQMMETLLMMDIPDIPDDATVIIVHDLDDFHDRQSLEMIEYDPQKNIVYLKGMISWEEVKDETD